MATYRSWDIASTQGTTWYTLYSGTTTSSNTVASYWYDEPIKKEATPVAASDISIQVKVETRPSGDLASDNPTPPSQAIQEFIRAAVGMTPQLRLLVENLTRWTGALGSRIFSDKQISDAVSYMITEGKLLVRASDSARAGWKKSNTWRIAGVNALAGSGTPSPRGVGIRWYIHEALDQHGEDTLKNVIATTITRLTRLPGIGFSGDAEIANQFHEMLIAGELILCAPPMLLGKPLQLTGYQDCKVYKPIMENEHLEYNRVIDPGRHERAGVGGSLWDGLLDEKFASAIDRYRATEPIFEDIPPSEVVRELPEVPSCPPVAIEKPRAMGDAVDQPRVAAAAVVYEKVERDDPRPIDYTKDDNW